MATYNGEKYISEQIESLLSQTVQDFVIYINDDCSTDNTYEIVCEYAKKYPNKINVSKSITNSGNAKYNFIHLMIRHKQEYIMLCDQDDVWKPNKIELTLCKMHQMEVQYGSGVPLLVHTDLEVVNEYLDAISPSFMKAMNANYSHTSLNKIVIQNTLTGCTAMYNGALANLIREEPKYMVMHDWWLILIASAFGKIGHITNTTILYRQHGNNSIGAKNVCTLAYKLNRLRNGKEIKLALVQTYQQAESFVNIFDIQLSKEQLTLLRNYCSIPLQSKLHRIISTFRLKTFKNGLARKIAQIAYL